MKEFIIHYNRAGQAQVPLARIGKVDSLLLSRIGPE